MKEEERGEELRADKRRGEEDMKDGEELRRQQWQ